MTISKNAQLEDLWDLVAGEELGKGIHRVVYVYQPDPQWVIKYTSESPKYNHLEWETWVMLAETPLAKWFAPCGWISQCGIFMLQKRAQPVPKEQYPTMVPSFFSDLKYKNFGLLDGKFVCIDYAGFLSTSKHHKWNGKMKKAVWWD